MYIIFSNYDCFIVIYMVFFICNYPIFSLFCVYIVSKIMLCKPREVNVIRQLISIGHKILCDIIVERKLIVLLKMLFGPKVL